MRAVNAENLHIGLTAFVGVVGLFVAVIGWFLRRDAGRMESILDKLDSAREQDRIEISLLKEKVAVLKSENDGIRRNVHTLRNQLTRARIIGTWPEDDGEGGK
jgi:hypothetical protein